MSFYILFLKYILAKAQIFVAHYKCGPKEYEYVSDCEECKKLDCQETGTSANIGYCFWSVDDGACLPSVDTNCGSKLVHGGCSECGQGHDQCAGECFWLDETELCVHAKGLRVIVLTPYYYLQFSLTPAGDLYSKIHWHVPGEEIFV